MPELNTHAQASFNAFNAALRALASSIMIQKLALKNIPKGLHQSAQGFVRRPREESHGTVAVCEDLDGNLQDLLQQRDQVQPEVS